MERGWRPEVEISTILTSFHCDNHLTQVQRAVVAAFTTAFCGCVLPSAAAWLYYSHRAPRRPALMMTSGPYRLPEHKRKIVQKELAELHAPGWRAPGLDRHCLFFHSTGFDSLKPDGSAGFVGQIILTLEPLAQLEKIQLLLKASTPCFFSDTRVITVILGGVQHPNVCK